MHPQAARLQVLDRLHHGVVGRRAAIGRAAVRPGSRRARAARDAVRRSRFRDRCLVRRFDARLDQAIGRSADRRRTSPRPATPRRVRRQRIELVERRRPCRPRRRRCAAFSGAVAPAPSSPVTTLGRIDELARAGDQGHAGEHVLQRVRIVGRDRADQLELKLRNAVAEIGAAPCPRTRRRQRPR